MLSERDQRDRRNFCEPFEPREERSDEVRAALATGATPPAHFLKSILGRVRWNFDGLECFDDFGMSESIPRNLWSGVRQRMERRQTIESVTDASETGPRLGARHERKCRRGAATGKMLKPEILKAENKKGEPEASRRLAAASRAATRSVPD